MSTTELNKTAMELLALKDMIAQLEAEAESLTDQIKAAMVDAGQESIEGIGWKASWKNVNSTRLDTKRFKAEQADLYQQYSKTSTVTRFILKSA